MALTGPREGPAVASMAALARIADELAERWRVVSTAIGAEVIVDGPALLGERAAFAGLTRQGSVSVGGAARFERASDGWVVLNLPRAGDVAALPALLGESFDPGDWVAVRERLATRSAEELVAQAGLLGLAVARPSERKPATAPTQLLGHGANRPALVSDRPLVVDLSSLWAGPLAGSLLARAGARVIKVEGTDRPDGARQGPKGFFDLLNGGKEAVTVDFNDPSDGFLRRLVEAADLVIEGSRPRVMDRLGIDPQWLAEQHGTSWLSITGHGRKDDPLRVGFGDDAAVAGGLWWEHDEAVGFVADAVADPLSGVVAAIAGAEALLADRAQVVDVALAGVAAWACANMESLAPRDWPDEAMVAAPRVRRSHQAAEPQGASSVTIRREFGVG